MSKVWIIRKRYVKWEAALHLSGQHFHTESETKEQGMGKLSPPTGKSGQESTQNVKDKTDIYLKVYAILVQQMISHLEKEQSGITHHEVCNQARKTACETGRILKRERLNVCGERMTRENLWLIARRGGGTGLEEERESESPR